MIRNSIAMTAIYSHEHSIPMIVIAALHISLSFASSYPSYLMRFGGFYQWGYPKSWVVYIGKPQTKMDDEQGYPYFRKPMIYPLP